MYNSDITRVIFLPYYLFFYCDYFKTTCTPVAAVVGESVCVCVCVFCVGVGVARDADDKAKSISPPGILS